MTRFALIALLAGTVAIAGCSQREDRLPGQRLDARAVLSPDGPAIQGEGGPATVALSLPGVRANSEWPQRAGSAQHYAGNVAIGSGTGRIWSNTIGQGDGKRHRITADPVVGGGLIYTLDSRARVSATTVSGGTAWTQNLVPGGEVGDSVSGGGVAYDGGRVFVTTGYGELVALDARSGAILWRQRVDTVLSGAPTVEGGTVYVSARNATGWAVRASDGRVEWQVGGTPGLAGVMGNSAPAVSGNTVVFPFSSGQVLAADRSSGQQIWSGQVGGSRTGRAIGLIRDMGGDPVISGNRVYAGTSSGRTAAFDLATGAEEWNARNGAANPVVPAGNSIFLVNDQAQLVRLDAATGSAIWTINLPEYTATKIRKQGRVHAHYGPVLAGNRLYVTSTDGLLRVFDPASGGLIGQAEIPGGAAAGPAIAGQTLYVVTRDGQLVAYR